jgi:hypothetical protein
MEATVLHRCLDPLIITARIEKVAVLQAATDENNVVENETLIR